MSTGNRLLATERIHPLIIQNILTAGYAVVPRALTVANRELLLNESYKLAWNQGPETYGTRITRQVFDEVSEFAPTGPFWQLARELEEQLEWVLGQVEPNPLPDPLRFNDIRLQRYQRNSYGIDPHRDGDSCYGLVALFVIRNGGHLYVCDDHAKTNARDLEAKAGDLVLFSGNGFGGKNVQPIHFLKMDERPRLTYGLRHKMPKKVR